jgi:proteasome lid subunit RPN8/RPN11
MSIGLTSIHVAKLEQAAAAAAPEECCGILLGFGTQIVKIVPTRNVHSTPESHFEIDPQALIDAHRAARQGEPQIVGYYHSHPAGPSSPSETDRAMAAGDGCIWAIIGSEGEIHFWRDGSDGFEALSYNVSSS